MKKLLLLGIFTLMMNCAAPLVFYIDDHKELQEFVKNEKENGSIIVKIDSTLCNGLTMFKVYYRPQK